jgi:hypothetical protein
LAIVNIFSQDGVGEAVAPGAAVGSGSPPGTLRRTRIALLSGAVAILLLGAAIAGVFVYLMIIRGVPAVTTGSMTGR